MEKGDTVGIITTSRMDGPSKATNAVVKKITKTMVVVEQDGEELKFDKQGYLKGGFGKVLITKEKMEQCNSEYNKWSNFKEVLNLFNEKIKTIRYNSDKIEEITRVITSVNELMGVE